MNQLLTIIVLIVAVLITAKAHGAGDMGRMEDWSQYISELVKTGLAFFWLLLLAMWGGTANYLSRKKRTGMPFSIAELLGEWLISGFAGVMTALACTHYSLDYYLTAFLVGIAGHAGGRALYLMEQWALRRGEFGK